MALNGLVKIGKGVLAAAVLSGCALEQDSSENVEEVKIVDTIPVKRNVCHEMKEDVEYNLAVDEFYQQWKHLDENEFMYLPNEWSNWMKDDELSRLGNRSNHDRFCRTFYLTKDLGKKVKVIVDMYQDANKVYSNSNWAGSEKHLNLLEEYLELTYPSWDFSLTSLIGLDENEKEEILQEKNIVQLFLGYDGTSHAGGSPKIYVHYDPIVGHEFAHTMGLGHDYDKVENAGQGVYSAPGENKCIMDRNWNQFGSPERFALGLDLVDNSIEISEVVKELNSKYLENY